jgi:hypothetical protein
LPLIFCIIFQTLFIGVWQFNLETKLRQKVSRFGFTVLRAFALKMFGLFAIFVGVFAVIIKPWFSWMSWIDYPLPASHLPESAIQTLLDLMNDIWEIGDLPSIWKLVYGNLI